MGRGALDIAQRPVPLHFGSAESGVDRRRQIAERAMRPDGVVIVLPDRQHFAGMGERGEQRLVQELVAQPAVEALDEGILLRLAGRDVVPFDPRLLRPAQDRHAGELGAVVGDDHRGPAARGDDGIELARDTQPGQRRIGDQRQAFAGEIVDDRQDAEAPAVGRTRRDRKSRLQRWFGPCGSAIGARVPRARLRPRAGGPEAAPRGRAAGASCGS